MNDFDGLTAVVTGGASGLGAATAAMLHSFGASVAILDREVGVPDSRFLSVGCDVTDSAGVSESIKSVASAFGGVDILVNCAGIGAVGTVADNDDEEWAKVFDINVVGIARVSRAALDYLKESQYAAIVNVSSVVASVGLPQRALYSASKGAVSALTYAMAADHLSDGIRVNAVMPGTADTPWVARLLAAESDPRSAEMSLKARQPMGRMVTAEEVARAVAYLASPNSASTTGVLLPVDGGLLGLRVS